MKKKLLFIPLIALLSSCSFEDLLFWKKKNNSNIESISIKSLPYQTTYFETETFNPNGLIISVNYSNKEEKVVSYQDNESQFTFSLSLDKELTKFDKSVTVTYAEKSTSFDIDVKEVTSISKTKLSYTYDDYTQYNYSDIDSCPLEGNPKLLIIPVWFSDSANFIDESKKEIVREDIAKAYVGTTQDTGWNSVKTYYEAESFHKITLDATVTDWYNISDSYTVYAPESAGYKTVALVKSASDYYFNNSSDSRLNYDSNRDGYLDGVILIYAAPDYDSLGDESSKNLWAYCYWTGQNASKASPTAKTFFWASYDFLYGSNVIEKTGHEYSRGYTENGVEIDTHCLIHEMGHVFGLQDYYDYSGYEFTPAGGFSMQDFNVGGHDPYSVMAYGWADPYIPNESMIISIGDFQSTHDVILLASHSTNSPFDEYLLLEYYTPTFLNEMDSEHAYRYNYPQGPNQGGIRLWHVDARLFSNYPSESNLTTNPKKGRVSHAMSITYDGDYASQMGRAYYNYNILQLIRNSMYSTYTPKENLRTSDLFYEGSSFDMNIYPNQFVNKTKMNDNSDLGWSFKVERIKEHNAIITLTKI